MAQVFTVSPVLGAAEGERCQTAHVLPGDCIHSPYFAAVNSGLLQPLRSADERPYLAARTAIHAAIFCENLLHHENAFALRCAPKCGQHFLLSCLSSRELI